MYLDVFNKYLRAHIERFKGKSIDTNDWKEFLYEYFADKVTWLNLIYLLKIILNLERNFGYS